MFGIISPVGGFCSLPNKPLCSLFQNLKVYTLCHSKQAEKEEQATKEVVVAPLKTDGGDFTSQPTEVWGNEIVTEPVTRSWAEEVPVPAPVTGGTTQPVPYSTSDDWATQVGFCLTSIGEREATQVAEGFLTLRTEVVILQFGIKAYISHIIKHFKLSWDTVLL
jgi:hypothetical protein